MAFNARKRDFSRMSTSTSSAEQEHDEYEVDEHTAEDDDFDGLIAELDEYYSSGTTTSTTTSTSTSTIAREKKPDREAKRPKPSATPQVTTLATINDHDRYKQRCPVCLSFFAWYEEIFQEFQDAPAKIIAVHKRSEHELMRKDKSGHVSPRDVAIELVCKGYDHDTMKAREAVTLLKKTLSPAHQTLHSMWLLYTHIVAENAEKYHYEPAARHQKWADEARLSSLLENERWMDAFRMGLNKMPNEVNAVTRFFIKLNEELSNRGTHDLALERRKRLREEEEAFHRVLENSILPSPSELFESVFASVHRRVLADQKSTEYVADLRTNIDELERVIMATKSFSGLRSVIIEESETLWRLKKEVASLEETTRFNEEKDAVLHIITQESEENPSELRVMLQKHIERLRSEYPQDLGQVREEELSLVWKYETAFRFRREVLAMRSACSRLRNDKVDQATDEIVALLRTDERAYEDACGQMWGMLEAHRWRDQVTWFLEVLQRIVGLHDYSFRANAERMFMEAWEHARSSPRFTYTGAMVEVEEYRRRITNGIAKECASLAQSMEPQLRIVRATLQARIDVLSDQQNVCKLQSKATAGIVDLIADVRRKSWSVLPLHSNKLWRGVGAGAAQKNGCIEKNGYGRRADDNKQQRHQLGEAVITALQEHEQMFDTAKRARATAEV